MAMDGYGSSVAQGALWDQSLALSSDMDMVLCLLFSGCMWEWDWWLQGSKEWWRAEVALADWNVKISFIQTYSDLVLG